MALQEERRKAQLHSGGPGYCFHRPFCLNGLSYSGELEGPACSPNSASSCSSSRAADSEPGAAHRSCLAWLHRSRAPLIRGLLSLQLTLRWPSALDTTAMLQLIWGGGRADGCHPFTFCRILQTFW